MYGPAIGQLLPPVGGLGAGQQAWARRIVIKLWLSLVLLASAGRLQAQSGSWSPPGADLSYPRTLLKARAIEEVRASLAAPGRLALYQGLWADVQAALPTDNTTASGRRARATFA